MAKVILDPLIKGIRGRLGGLVYRQSPSGETIVSNSPDMSSVEWSPAQKEQRRRFKQANAYAKAAMADPAARAAYEKRAVETGRKPYRLAMSDFFKGNELLPRIKNQAGIVIWGNVPTTHQAPP